MKVTIKNIVDFYRENPDLIGEIDVKTRFGFKKIQYADLTSRNSEVYEVILESGKKLKTSPEHLLLNSTGKWSKVSELEEETFLFTENGLEKIISIEKINSTMDLYDLQVEDVHEFYANGIVSHNSTILDALAFSLFGKTFRNINLPQLPNSINQKDCLVELEFTAGGSEIKVIRGLNPKKFEIYKNGTLIEQSAKSKDYQRQFEETILKMSFKAFCQVVILGSSNYVPFMRLTASDRRSIVESILDIDVFTSMNTVLKSRMSENKDFIKNIAHKIELQEEKIRSQLAIIENLKSVSQDAIDNNHKEIEESKNKLNSLLESIQSYKNKIDSLKSQITDKDSVANKLKKLESFEKQIQKQIKTMDERIESYSEMTHCSSCQQTINEEHKTSLIEKKKNKKEELKKAFSELLQKKKEISSRKSEIDEVLESINTNHEKIYEINSEVNGINTYIQRLQRSNESLLSSNGETEQEEDKLNDLRSEEKNLVVTKEELVENDSLYGMASVLLKDSGIKRRIISHYIPIINKVINSYLQQMNFFVLFELDEEFNEKIKSRHRDEFTYNSFSEGEKRKIDLALLFAWRKIAQVKNSVNTNLLILDEILDGSLDNNSTESFLDIIASLDKNTNLFVISHKPKEVIQDRFEKQITFVKKNNFSQIER